MAKKTCVAFLDLLGFSNHVKYAKKEEKDSSNPVNMLITASQVLETRLSDQQTHPIETYSDELRPLAKRRAVDTFTTFLPMSDSIFIVGDDLNAFIEQVSSFMCDCFTFTSHAYIYPDDETAPENVTVTNIRLTKEKEVVAEEKPAKYYPNIFRGGFCIGEAVLIDSPCLFRNEKDLSPNMLKFIKEMGGALGFGKTLNITGEGVVNAVKLEKNGGKGPKLFINDDVANQLNDELRLLVSCDQNAKKHFLWPAYTIIASNGMQSQQQSNYFDFLSATISLWKAYENKEKSVSCHYYEFMRITAQAYLSIFKHYANEDEAKAILHDFFNQKGINFLSLSNML